MEVRKLRTLRFTVGWHLAVGLLLMWLDPLASLFGEQAGQIIGLRVMHPLLAFLGLFWMLVAAALISGRGFVIKTAMAAHFAALLLPFAGIVLAVILLLPSEPRGHMALSPAPVAFLLIILSVVVTAFAIVCLVSLWRLLRRPAAFALVVKPNSCSCCGFSHSFYTATVCMNQLIISVFFRGAKSMKRFIFPAWLCGLAVVCVGCTPTENTPTPSHAAEDSDPPKFTFEGSEDAASISFSADSMTLASANRDKTISLWDVSTRQESARLAGHRVPAVSLAFSPEGNFLASAGDDHHTKKGEILIWDVKAKESSKTLEVQDVYFSFVCFSPDGKTFASTGPRHSITLWDVETWTQKSTLESHTNPVRCLEFRPDGKLLAAGVSHYNGDTWQAEVKLWNMVSGEEVGTLEHRWSIQTVAHMSALAGTR